MSLNEREDKALKRYNELIEKALIDTGRPLLKFDTSKLTPEENRELAMLEVELGL